MTRKLTFLILALFALIAGPSAKAWGQNPTHTWDLTSTSTDWTAEGNETYFSQPYGYKKANGTLTNANVADFTTYATEGKTITSIKVGFKGLRNGNTVSKITISLVDADGNILTSGDELELTNASSASNTAYVYSTFTTGFTGATGFMMKVTTFGKNVLINGASYEIVYTEAGAPELQSIAVSGTPSKTTYEAGEEFAPAGLVVTGTYDDASTAEITSGITWTVTPSPLTAGTTSVSVTATVGNKTSPAYTVNGLTVTAALPKITITADKIADFENAYAEYTWTANNVSGKCWAYRGGSSGNYNIQFNKTTYVYNTTAVPGRITSIKMTKVSGTTRTWSVYGADVALTADNYTTEGTQIGSAQEVSSEAGTTWNVPNDKNYAYFYITKPDGGTNIGEIVITYEPAKTPTTIAIKTAPNQTEYYAGETFNPAGLVITATYDDESAEDIAYADHANDFTFSPDLTTALTTTNTSVTITYGGKTVNQTITVTEAPKYVVSYYSLGILLTEEQVSRGETCNAPSVTAPEGWGFVGWTENGEYLYNTTAPESFSILAPIEATHSLHAVFSKLVGNFENKNASVSIENYALANNWVNGEKYLTVIVDENISVNATAKGTTGQYNSAAQDWRMYQTSQNYSQWKINATNNSTLNSVIFTYSSSNNGIISYEGNTYISGSTIALSGNESSTFTVGNTGTADNGQVRITNISIAYTIGSGTRYYAINRVIDAETTISEPTTWEGKTEVYGTITVNSILTADEIINSTASNLVIEDGAQLIHHNAGVNATVLKSITGYSDEASRDGYYLIANPTNNTTVANLTNENGYDLYTFNPAGDGAGNEWINMKSSQAVANGTGYLYANSSDVTLEFAGELTPASETEVTLVKATAGTGTGIDFPGFNLIGNPYACNAYPTDEGGNFMSYYKMNEDGNELELLENIEAVTPCEGFFVEAAENNQKIYLTTETPVTVPSLLNITVSQNRGNVIDRAIVSFDGRSNLHKFMMNPAHTNIRLAKNGEEFAAVSTEAEGELPVNFKAEKNGTYTITVNTENVEANYLHLIDNMTGMDTDLLSTPSYTFNATTSDYASRFKLVFGVKNDNEEMSQTSNFAYISNGEMVISNEGRATLQVIDVMGRIISSEEINGEARISTEGMTAGVYVLNLNGNVQKIVVR